MATPIEGDAIICGAKPVAMCGDKPVAFIVGLLLLWVPSALFGQTHAPAFAAPRAAIAPFGAANVRRSAMKLWRRVPHAAEGGAFFFT